MINKRSKRANIFGGTGYKPPEHNLTATSASSTTNDISEEYKTNSLWFNISSDPIDVYRCVDNTEDNAIWVETTLETSELDTWFATKTTKQTTGVSIDYTNPKIYNTYSSPGTGNITDNTTNAILGVIQKIYHNDSSEPSFPAHWVLLSGAYSINELNIIMAEYIDNSRVEYWIVQKV